MQLKKTMSIRAALATASSSLLGLTASVTQVQAEGWEVDTAILIYSEIDRVTAVEPVVNIHKEIADNEYVDVRLVLDSLTGSSANGAVPSTNSSQTFTSPSGNSGYTVEAGETPLDPSFLDTRGAINIAWDKPLSSQVKAVFSFNLSLEFDYRSLGLSAAFTRDVNARNTSLSAAFSVGNDQVNAVGGIPVGGSEMQAPNSPQREIARDDDSKSLYDVMLGVTQIFSRRSLGQLNYSYAVSDGYLTDPYKIVSVIDTDVNNNNNVGEPESNRYESRPDHRVSQSLYTKLVHQFNDDVVHVSYRYFWDDWGITSHTIDFHYRYEINSRYYLQPHIRYYKQSAADFYRYFITDAESVPLHLSADYRLGDMTTTTIGLHVGKISSKTSEFSLRLEMITQSGESHPDQAFGLLTQQDLFPDVRAYVIQLNYNLEL